jgi:hypothetical protein
MKKVETRANYGSYGHPFFSKMFIKVPFLLHRCCEGMDEDTHLTNKWTNRVLLTLQSVGLFNSFYKKKTFVGRNVMMMECRIHEAQQLHHL